VYSLNHDSRPVDGIDGGKIVTLAEDIVLEALLNWEI
jgi:hypothetical protein